MGKISRGSDFGGYSRPYIIVPKIKKKKHIDSIPVPSVATCSYAVLIS